MPDLHAQPHVTDRNTGDVFVGPRPFERSEDNLFFGRDREISELLSLVTANRVVLCYAPSGAGKTSLINAGLQPRLETEGFEVLPSTRVKGLIPEGVDQSTVVNIYVFNTLLSLAKDSSSPAELASHTIAQYLASLPHLTDQEDFPSPRILIFDQFEELLTSYLERWQEREGFFQQVGDALQADPLLRVLFVMREDYLARIEPFMHSLKPLSQSRFRLDLLGPGGAHAAVTGPLRGTPRHFKDGVVDTLVEELLKVRVESTHGEATEVIGEYVEPVQLQVVCRNLWTSLPEDVQEISHAHLKAYGDVDQALREFYESCLTDSKTDLHTNEADLRQWFEHQLITPAGTRGIVFRDTQQTATLANTVVDFLENKHIIRGEWRAGSRWYELTHDRLIEPIQRANENWRSQRQARRNRMLAFTGVAVVVLLVLFSAVLSFQTGTAYAVPTDSTSVAEIRQTIVSQSNTLVVEAQSTASVAQGDALLSKSRQLAAEALIANDRNLSLLLAIQANKSFDTPEARRSLHKILSAQGVSDENFLRIFNPKIISPTLVKRLDDHGGPVVSIAVSSDSKRFVSGSDNGTVLLWDAVTAQPIGSSLTTNSGSISSVAYSPDGLLIAAAGQDEVILLWDASTGEPVGAPLRGHVGLVTNLAFSPDGKLLASGGLDFRVRIWDVASQRLVDELKHDNTISSLAWSPDSKSLAVGTLSSEVSFWSRSESGVFDNIDTLSALNGPVQSIAWSSDGKLMALGMASEEAERPSGDVVLWDVAQRQSIVHPLPNYLQRVRTVAFDPGGTTLAMGLDDGTIYFWDIKRGRLVGEPLKAHDHRVMSIAFTPDGRYLMSAGYDRTIAIWNLQSPTRSLAVSPIGDLLATSQGSVITIWNASGDQTDPLNILSGHKDDVFALAFGPDGKTLVSSGRDHTLRVWDLQSGQLIGTPLSTTRNTTTLLFSPDGSVLAEASESGAIQLLNPFNGNISNIQEINQPVFSLQFGEAGETLYAVSKDGSLFSWDLTSNTRQVISLPGAQRSIVSSAISPDGQKIAYFQEGGTAILDDDARAHGIELSLWDQTFDPTVNSDDIDFIVIKATEGTQFVDPKFEEFVKSIQSVPMRGAFHYFREGQPWKEQADLFLSTVKNKGFHFYILDLEVRSQDGSTDFLADAEQWLKYVDEQVDGKVMLAALGPYLSEFGPAGEWMKDWPLLVLQYPLKPDRNGNPALPEGFSDWRIWNYTDQGSGREYGVGTNSILLMVYNGTPFEMAQWLGINTFSIFDRASGAVVYPKQAIQVSSLNGMAFSPDGSYLAVAGPGTVTLLSTASKDASATISADEVSTLTVGGRSILSLAFLPDGNMLVIGTDDGTVLLWDLSLLGPSPEMGSMIDIACSQVRQNFTEAEWDQYVSTDTDREVTCLNAPLP